MTVTHTEAVNSFPILYKKTNTGAIQSWRIWVEQDNACGFVCLEWGQVDGKLQLTKDTIKEGKNPGKANATTPIQQAAKEAESKWLKQKKKGYVESIEEAKQGVVDNDVIKGGIVPMLAHKYKEHRERVVFPAYAQPKLDGHRCIAVITCSNEGDVDVTLWTRTRKLITSVPHINQQLKVMFHDRYINCVPWGKFVLDGELYLKQDGVDFEKLTSFLRRQEPSKETEVVQYHVFDIYSGDTETYRQRVLDKYNGFYELIQNSGNGIIKIVDSVLVQNEEEFMNMYATYMEHGYEGIMYRHPDYPYEQKRSYGLLKYKEFEDKEFKIIGVEEGRGKLAGHAIFICESDAGEFRVKLKGSQETLQSYWQNQGLVIGKMLTVRYQNLTSDGLPRFPVGIAVRDYE
jgi:DNA ligase 1